MVKRNKWSPKFGVWQKTTKFDRALRSPKACRQKKKSRTQGTQVPFRRHFCFACPEYSGP